MPVQPAPATIFNKTMETALSYIRSGSPTQFELKKLEREVEHLAKVDLAGSFEISGFIAALRGDLESIDDKYRRALTITDDFIGTRVRYMQLLGATAQTQKIYDAFVEFYPVLRNDPSALRSLESTLSFSGWITSAHNLAQDLKRMGVEPEKKIFAERIEDFGLSESDLAAPVGFSQRWLISKDLRATFSQSMSIPCEDGKAHVLFQLGVERSPEEVARLEWDLFGALEEAAFPAEQSGLIRVTLASITSTPNADH